jgi:hypothetical protein
MSSRGDWTPIELFLLGEAAIKSHVRRLIVVFDQSATLLTLTVETMQYLSEL